MAERASGSVQFGDWLVGGFGLFFLLHLHFLGSSKLLIKISETENISFRKRIGNIK